MGTGKTYSTKYLLDSNNSSGVAGQVLSTTSTGIDWVDANTVPGSGLWLASGNNIYNSNSGNVGIGTTSPGTKLQVEGSIQANSQGRFKGWYTSGSGLALETGVSGGNGYVLTYNRDTTAYSSTIIESTGIQFAAHSSGKFYFTGGNVGIGTTSPDALLDIGVNNIITLDDTGSSTGFIGMGSYNDGTKNRAQGASYYGFGLEIDRPNQNISFNSYASSGVTTEGTNILVLKRTGNVGIGTDSPNAKLEVNSAITFSTIDTFGQLVVKAASGSTGDMLNIGVDTTNSVAFIQANDRGVGRIPLSLQRYGGNVGIGTTSPTGLLTLSGDFSNTATAGLYITNTGTATADDLSPIAFTTRSSNWGTIHAGTIACGTTSATDGGGYLIFGTSSTGQFTPTERIRITSAGTLLLRSGAFPTNQDSPFLYRIGGGSLAIGSATETGSGAHVALYTNSLERMRITSTGNVGIGTTSPGAKLHIDVPTEDNQPAFKITKVSDSGENAMEVYHGTSSALRGIADFTNALGSVMFLRGDGNVGIGTTSPNDGKLQIIANSSSNWGTYIYNTNSSGLGLHVETNSYGTEQLLRLSSLSGSGGSNTVKMVVRADGNVGIGTTSPSNKLHVYGDSNHDVIARFEATGTGTNDYSEIHIANNNNNRLILGSIGSNYTNSDWAGQRYVYSTAGDLALKAVASDGNVRIYAGGSASERMRVASNGGVGINTTNPTEKLEVNGNVKVQGDIIVNSDIELGPSSRIQLDDTPTASTASGSGTIVNWSVSDTTTAGTLYTVKTNGAWTPVDADNESTSIGMLAIALSSNANLGMLLQGFFYKASHGFTIGLPLYISNTAGAFSTTRPTGTNDYVRIIGYATSANYIYFDPDKTWVQVA